MKQAPSRTQALLVAELLEGLRGEGSVDRMNPKLRSEALGETVYCKRGRLHRNTLKKSCSFGKHNDALMPNVCHAHQSSQQVWYA